MFLGISKYAHENQSHDDKSGYDILHHDCHSTWLARYEVSDRAAKDKPSPELRARQVGSGWSKLPLRVIGRSVAFGLPTELTTDDAARTSHSGHERAFEPRWAAFVVRVPL